MDGGPAPGSGLRSALITTAKPIPRPRQRLRQPIATRPLERSKAPLGMSRGVCRPSALTLQLGPSVMPRSPLAGQLLLDTLVVLEPLLGLDPVVLGHQLGS